MFASLASTALGVASASLSASALPVAFALGGVDAGLGATAGVLLLHVTAGVAEAAVPGLLASHAGWLQLPSVMSAAALGARHLRFASAPTLLLLNAVGPVALLIEAIAVAVLARLMSEWLQQTVEEYPMLVKTSVIASSLVLYIWSGWTAASMFSTVTDKPIFWSALAILLATAMFVNILSFGYRHGVPSSGALVASYAVYSMWLLTWPTDTQTSTSSIFEKSLYSYFSGWADRSWLDLFLLDSHVTTTFSQLHGMMKASFLVPVLVRITILSIFGLLLRQHYSGNQDEDSSFPDASCEKKKEESEQWGKEISSLFVAVRILFAPLLVMAEAHVILSRMGYVLFLSGAGPGDMASLVLVLVSGMLSLGIYGYGVFYQADDPWMEGISLSWKEE